MKIIQLHLQKRLPKCVNRDDKEEKVEEVEKEAEEKEKEEEDRASSVEEDRAKKPSKAQIISRMTRAFYFDACLKEL
jgi:hypothetical protein